MSVDATPRQARIRNIARREVDERIAGEQRRVAAYLTAARLTPGRFIHRQVLRQDYQAAARELYKLMSG